MSISEFGHLVRELRSQVNKTLRAMAEEIGVSPAYLSAVEVGLKSPSEDLVARTAGYFRKFKGLKATQIAAIYAAADRSKRAVDVSSLDGQGRVAVAFFARKWKDMDQNSREKFLRDVETPAGGTKR